MRTRHVVIKLKPDPGLTARGGRRRRGEAFGHLGLHQHGEGRRRATVQCYVQQNAGAYLIRHVRNESIKTTTK